MQPNTSFALECEVPSESTRLTSAKESNHALGKSQEKQGLSTLAKVLIAILVIVLAAGIGVMIWAIWHHTRGHKKDISGGSIFVGGKEFFINGKEPALYQYIAQDDPAFEWHEIPDFKPIVIPKSTSIGYRIEFTSLQWLTEKDSNRSFWKHYLTIIVPDQIEIDNFAGLYITACLQDDHNCANKEIQTVVPVVEKIKAPIAILTQIPNQSIIFADDPLQLERTEDVAVSYTWARFLETPNRPDLLMYFPMAKASVQSTRVLTEWSKAHPEIIKNPFEQFYLYGGSKRGAATWYAGAYMGHHQRNRIVGMAPLVFDVLNMEKTLMSMYQQLGGWSFAFSAYYDTKVLAALTASEGAMAPIAKHIDPASEWYSQGLNAVPKLVVGGTGDQFFLINNDHFYWPLLKNKMRLIVPDADHGLVTDYTYLANGLSGHIQRAAQKKPLPRWEHKLNYETNTIELTVSPKPQSVSLFKATTIPSNEVRLDFRVTRLNLPGSCLPPAFETSKTVCRIPKIWQPSQLDPEEVEDGFKYAYTATEDEVPTDGKTWLGFFIIAAWIDDPVMGNQVYTTNTLVAPFEFPYKDCRPDCTINLV